MPRTYGDCFLHVNELDAIVETSRPLLELPPEPPTEVHRRIAAHVAELIPDGATLQTRHRRHPRRGAAALENHRDLGIHSEMVSDGVIPLIENGVINGARKSCTRARLSRASCWARKRLFDFIHDNPFFEFHPTALLNDPFMIAQNDRMVAINSAIADGPHRPGVRRFGGLAPYSGFGGQVDFIRGAARSKGGKPIIALPSTAKNGAISRIVPVLDPGAGVVTSRARRALRGDRIRRRLPAWQELRQRAEALIEIADPKFREEL